MKFILNVLIPQDLSFWKSEFDQEFLVADAIVYGRFEIFCEILKFHATTLNQSVRHFLFPWVEMCSKTRGREGPKYFELLFNSRAMHFKSYFMFHILRDTLNFENEYLEIMLDLFFKNEYASFLHLSDQEIDKIMKILLSENILIDDTNSSKRKLSLALKFAYVLGLKKEFKFLMDEKKWDQNELIELLEKYIQLQIKDSELPNHFTNLDLLLSKLDENAIISEPEVSSLVLISYLDQSNFQCFSRLWNDERMKRTQEFANELILTRAGKMNEEFLNLLISECSQNEQVEFEFEDKTTIKTDILTHRWLTFLRFGNLQLPLEKLEKILKINWTEQVLDWSLHASTIEKVEFILKNPLIDRKFWNSQRIHKVLIQCCRNSNSSLVFSELLKMFPNINLNENNNESLVVILENDFHARISPIFEKMEYLFKFKDEKERQEMIDLAIKFDRSEHAKRIAHFGIFVEK